MTLSRKAIEAADENIRMNAYYYSFDRTGLKAIDEILSAVADAGKRYHHTDQWNETTDPSEPTPVEVIQAAADNAASLLRRLAAALARVKARRREEAAQTATWQPIATAPKDQDVLVMWLGEVKMARFMTVRSRGDLVDPRWLVYLKPYYSACVNDAPTHWMPLPEPPE